ncbi:MAG: hypothetical protein GC129_07040 [Proteobacteria bacterium]|nr:hypothetical protein [Pseudomonadota bacterium]
MTTHIGLGMAIVGGLALAVSMAACPRHGTAANALPATPTIPVAVGWLGPPGLPLCGAVKARPCLVKARRPDPSGNPQYRVRRAPR